MYCDTASIWTTNSKNDPSCPHQNASYDLSKENHSYHQSRQEIQLCCVSQDWGTSWWDNDRRSPSRRGAQGLGRKCKGRSLYLSSNASSLYPLNEHVMYAPGSVINAQCFHHSSEGLSWGRAYSQPSSYRCSPQTCQAGWACTTKHFYF